MSLILHLSDLHLLANESEQESIFDGLVQALRELRLSYGRRIDLLAITGDVFDSATSEPKLAMTRFLELFAAIGRALGEEPPTLIVPGNHDRRRAGLFGPHRETLFHSLKSVLGDRAWVHGCTTPFLSAVLPQAFHGQPFRVVAYDSTYLPHGLLSAGGALRQEDLLFAAAQIADAPADEPVLFLLHHHLVPTPITDLGAIELNDQAPRWLRWGVERLLPEIVAHADREELTMTALGAGTALSTLHTLGRAVLVLHGHKHYATCRLLDGTFAGHGDVLIASAGSAGTAQHWAHRETQNAARLWPSFNVIDWTGPELRIDTVSFPWRGAAGPIAIYPLVRARRSGSQWNIERMPVGDLSGREADLALNHSSIRLRRGARGEHWDYDCERIVSATNDLLRYMETVEGVDGGKCRIEPFGAEVPLPADVHLAVGGVTRYRVEGAAFRTLLAARAAQGHRASAFAQVSLMNRYVCRKARLEVTGLGQVAQSAFASATDLGTGLERPLRVDRCSDQNDAREETKVCAEIEDCPARTLLRIYWPLETAS